MLDNFEILTTSGVVLWSKSFAPLNSNLINSFITDVFIEERAPAAGAGAGTGDSSASRNPLYRKDQYTLRWTTFKDLGLIFVAVYQSLIHLTWIDKLLDNVKIIFVDLYKDQLKKPHTSIVECPFDGYFDQQMRELENISEGTVASNAQPTVTVNGSAQEESEDDDDVPPPPVPGLVKGRPKISESAPSSSNITPLGTPGTSRPASPAANHLLSSSKSGPGGRGSRRARKVASYSAHASSGEESSLSRSKNAKSGVKSKRRWDADGLADDDDDDAPLDYSAPASRGNDGTDAPDEGVSRPGAVEAVAQETWGRKTGKGEFVLKDLDEEVHSILSSADAKKTTTDSSQGVVGSSLGALGGLFKNIVGGKTLTKADLEKPLKGMEEHLLKKNVAREAAMRLIDSVESSLIGVKTGNFQTIEATIRNAMTSSLKKILTPTSSLDLLHSIALVNQPPRTTPPTSPRPYVISVVGVNGVGKSTNLSKLAFFLLQNGHRVLIAACDTFRSGAVEQLRVHARNLSELTSRLDNGADVSLYEKGYGKDAASIARDAVAHGAANNYSVVLIDTAGRRHNDSRLMSSLEKFAKLAQPDKILMVGEALVGTDSVAQARNFDAAFGVGRKLDGFIISKCDTVGDMMGTLVSMVHATGVPVVFLGTGQHYSDLRTLNVNWAVSLLMA
ncbi:MAG: hypothetical protein M4579_001570 [Chaenotheca gracillima]|nr:MAG: hypothetical protein M4579_001570 [Chaenotheca gracillima]